jgi:nucleoid-associated protein YgaU
MGRLKARKTAKKAKLEAEAAALATKQAARDAAESLKELSSAVADQVRSAKLDEKAGELAEKVRDSEALARTQAKGAELAALARDKIHEAGLDAKAAELAERARESEKVQQATDTARDVSDEALERLGKWLSTGARAEKLGVQRKRRGFSWIAATIGVGVGFAVGLVVSRRGSDLRDELVTEADRFYQDTPDAAAPPAERPLEDKIRTALGSDPRTSDLPKLNINVAEGTVFVRGPLPEGIDEQAVRDVITKVPGVTDVDLQLTSAGA